MARSVQIDNATYQMLAIDGGVKYRGFSFDVEYYRRRLENFTTRGPGVLPFAALRDTRFQIQASAMIAPQFAQVYAGGSRVYGEYGDPRDVRAGVTFFPWKNEVVRWNFEFIHLKRSPVGSLTLPYSVGGNGPVFHSSFMLWFDRATGARSTSELLFRRTFRLLTPVLPVFSENQLPGHRERAEVRADARRRPRAVCKLE
jgi:hypothetical protein